MRRRKSKAVAIFAFVFFEACALGADVTIEAFNLQIVPATAQDGDLISLNFTLNVVAEEPVTLTALVDGDSYSNQTVPRLYSGVFTWEIGDAGDLIDRFGLGDHTVRVRVQDPASGRTANTEQLSFSLVATP